MSDQQRSSDGSPEVGGLAGDDLGYDSEGWATARPRRISPDSGGGFEEHMREVPTAPDMPHGTPSAVDTPRQFLRVLYEATSGYEGDTRAGGVAWT
ncbi:hypothetical protein AB0D24_33435 [Streptomyces javensis]|uniref:hypothetical protein n=1 Tax=Streptomyces javensis TaxID=114698 RepID=UPI0033F3E3B6